MSESHVVTLTGARYVGKNEREGRNFVVRSGGMLVRDWAKTHRGEGGGVSRTRRSVGRRAGKRKLREPLTYCRRRASIISIRRPEGALSVYRIRYSAPVEKGYDR